MWALFDNWFSSFASGTLSKVFNVINTGTVPCGYLVWKLKIFNKLLTGITGTMDYNGYISVFLELARQDFKYFSKANKLNKQCNHVLRYITRNTNDSGAQGSWRTLPKLILSWLETPTWSPCLILKSKMSASQWIYLHFAISGKNAFITLGKKSYLWGGSSNSLSWCSTSVRRGWSIFSLLHREGKVLIWDKPGDRLWTPDFQFSMAFALLYSFDEVPCPPFAIPFLFSFAKGGQYLTVRINESIILNGQDKSASDS